MTGWEKILAVYISEKDLISKIYEKSNEIIFKKILTDNPVKNRSLEQFANVDFKMANK